MAQFIDQTRCTVSNNEQRTPEWLAERDGLITGSKRSTISYLLAMKIKFEGFIRDSDPKIKESNKIKLDEINEKKIIAARKFCGLIPDIIEPEYMESVQYGLDNEDRLRDELSIELNQHIHQI